MPSAGSALQADEFNAIDHSANGADGQIDAAPESHPHQPSSASGWFALARHSVRAWWEFHPVRVAGVVAEPVLAEYARKKPLKLVGIADLIELFATRDEALAAVTA